DETLKNLGFAINIQKEFCFILKVAVSWIFFNVLTCPVVTLYHFSNLEKITQIPVIVVVYHGYHVNLLIFVKFFLLINHMRLRFKSINKVLTNFLRSHTKNMTQEGTNDRWASSVQKNLELDFLCNVGRVHLELGKLCRITTTVYGTPLAFTTIGFFVNIIGSLYCQYLGLIKENSNIYEIMLSIVITLIWIVPFCLSFLSVNYICKETVNEWKQTGVILDKLELESKNTEIQTEIGNFSAQVQRNTLKFSPCGFFDLDFYFVRDFTAAVATYLVIMLQTLSSEN
ncbi:GSCOCT00013987001.2-RA-CDS, partial [Cotesia congregata]